MTETPSDEIVSSWSGAFRRRAGQVVAREAAPSELGPLVERMTARLDGLRTVEEERILAAGPALALDRRLGREAPRGPPTWTGAEPPSEPLIELHRRVVLEVAARRLAAGWDPSVHLDEAVRSMGELDHTLNLFGERLVSWSGRDGPPTGDEPTAASVARRLLDPPSESPASAELPGGDPAILRARAELAGLYERTAAVRRGLEVALEESIPRRAPNLSALLGPLLAARLLSLAGGLDRMARLPSGTIQVLGAEKAFFEHLRGRAPPPRHGVLFLHPDVQGAPKRQRGRIARALAAKAAIAARLDASGAPLRPELVDQFRRRAAEVRSAGPGKGPATPKRRAVIRPATSRSSRGPDAPRA